MIFEKTAFELHIVLCTVYRFSLLFVALKALSLESDDSDESEQTEDLNAQILPLPESLQIGGNKNPSLHTSTNMESSKPYQAALQKEVIKNLQTKNSNPQEQEVFRHYDPESVEGELSHDVENEEITDFAMKVDHSVDKSLGASGNTEDEAKQAFKRELSVSEMNESPQSSISLPEVISMSELDKEDEGQDEAHSHFHDNDPDPEMINPLEIPPGQENDNVINQILEEGVRKEDEEEVRPEQNRRDGEPQVPELHLHNEDQVIDHDLDLIVINPLALPHGDRGFNYEVEQDDPETESSTEMDVHDDRIESDQSELQTTDNSNLSNVDISDLMENIHVNRQYLHHPKPWIDVFLNAALRYTKLSQENQKLKDEANSLRNEVYDLRSEIIRLKYKKSQEIALQDANRKRESLTSVLVKANQLEQENSDLRLEIGRLKYGYHGNKNLENVKEEVNCLFIKTVTVKLNEENINKQQEQANEEKISPNPCSKVKSLQNELLIERERSEMWRNLYKDKEEELKKKILDEENATHDVFGCMKLMLKNLSLPVNISVNISKLQNIMVKFWQNIEEQWKKLQNVSLNSFVEILKSFVTPETNKEKGNNWNSGNKKGHTRWTDTVKDALNKTRESMSDVTQQIQDTWKQVKNLSHDFWKKHEPTVSEHLRKVQETMHEATQQLKDHFHKSKWFGKKRKGRKNRNNKDNQDHTEKTKENGKHKKSSKASTKRRGFQEQKHKNRKQNKHLWNNNSNNKFNKQYNKLHDKMKNLNFDQFEKLSCKKRKKTLNVFNKIWSKFNFDRPDEKAGMWCGCQNTWWSKIVYGQSTAARPECVPYLFSWQLMVSNCQDCQNKICKKRKASNHYDQEKYNKHGRHEKKKWKFHQEFNIHEEPDEDSFGKDDKFQENENHMNSDSMNEINIDDLPGLVFDDAIDLNKKPNSTEFSNENKEDNSECNPETDVCSEDEQNWYLRQMEQRQYEREHQYTPDGKGNWMFKRAEERDFQRTYPDDWYFRRWNKKDLHEPPPPPKHFMMTDNEDCFEEDGHISCVEW
ncbi:hypothetical protein KUTeg_018137 [Tegillarca granosa]|uniref:Uncharacterized protein n=1 Tax=Tegillarca granosa TaxID=220873 RepID=A0ABQ9EGZ3_TEGGR|nr:hypothetical protein KUTeg_018137 [Tegillarca granosa]